MNRFLFITHLTPQAKRSLLRQKLIDLYYHALMEQTYAHWDVLLFGEPELSDPRFHYFSLPDVAREEKPGLIKELLTNREVSALIEQADYIVKLDDDDIISRDLLSRLAGFRGDLYYDEWHTFGDVTSGQITQQKRNWIASTCVHRSACAMDEWTGEGSSAVGNLLYSDHSKAWHVYYRDKKITAAPKSEPCYLRVLSPTSVTSSQRKSAEINFAEYDSYLAKFGNWDRADIAAFRSYGQLLTDTWKSGTGQGPRRLPDFGRSFGARLKAKLNKLFGRNE